MNKTEDKMLVSFMRLIGVPKQLRHNIYTEALHNVQAVKDLSVAAVDFLGNVIDWVRIHF